MADPESGFPGTHTTTTSTSVVTNLKFDPTYVRSLPGTLKTAQLVLNLIGFICVVAAINHTSGPVQWFSLVSMGGFWITLILFILFLFHVVEKMYSIPWLLVEWVYCTIWTFFYFTAATAAATKGSYESALAAAAFFGYVAMLVYGFDGYLKYISWRAGDIPQGNKVVKTASSISPEY